MLFGNAHQWYEQEREKGWQKNFAWFPVEIGDFHGHGLNPYVWLEWFEYRITGLNDSRYTSSATYETRRFTNKHL